MSGEEDQENEIPTLPTGGKDFIAGEERDAFTRFETIGFKIRQPPPPHKLDDYITPDSQLFQTSHMGTVIVDSSKYILIIDGLVPKPLAFTLDQLKSLPQSSITAFHECYGSPLKPPTEALWRIGNVKWTGVKLSHLLSVAEFAPNDETRFIWSEGLDRGVFAGVEADRYQKDLPIAKALRPEVLVAYQINGEALSLERGGPVRLVVPGYFGTNSTKWLSRLSVQKTRAQGPYTTTFYNEIDPEDTKQESLRPVWNVEVNSMITMPSPGEVVSGSRLTIEGWAWGDDEVARVEVSCDGGDSWKHASIQSRSEYAWQRFQMKAELLPGSYTLVARATAITGESQPLTGRRNHVHRVTIECR
jgi:DMSO/TMAO reductase YedYZ molybdopterin-dependent catalytic subunit